MITVDLDKAKEIHKDKLRRARDEYEKNNTYDVELFLAWMRDTYGIDIIQNKNGLTADYEILDEQKHLL